MLPEDLPLRLSHPYLPFLCSLLICISLPLNHPDSSVMSGCRNFLCNFSVYVSLQWWVCARMHMFCACLRDFCSHATSLLFAFQCMCVCVWLKKSEVPSLCSTPVCSPFTPVTLMALFLCFTSNTHKKWSHHFSKKKKKKVLFYLSGIPNAYRRESWCPDELFS